MTVRGLRRRGVTLGPRCPESVALLASAYPVLGCPPHFSQGKPWALHIAKWLAAQGAARSGVCTGTELALQ